VVFITIGCDMAVYTPLSEADLQDLLSRFALGDLIRFAGAAGGIENTTYFLTCQLPSEPSRDYVLSIVETGDEPQILFSSALTTALHRAGLPVPCPIPDSGGQALQHCLGKPALIFPKAAGQHLVNVSVDHCRAIGEFQARAHKAAATLTLQHPNQRGVLWLNEATHALLDKLPSGDAALLQEQSQRYRRMSETSPDLPWGAIHGDLFRDNALFKDDRLVAVFDFYNACDDWLLLDVAIAVNDWCCDGDGEIDKGRANALINAYHRVRPFTRCEHQYWQDMLCLAATRFWVSRLLVRHCPDLMGGKFRLKDPDEFREKLQCRMVNFPALPDKPLR